MKKTTSLLSFAAFLFGPYSYAGDFLAEQKRYSRVRAAIAAKEAVIVKKLADNNINANDMHIIITAFKDEGILRIYAKNSSEELFKLIESYAICAKSGTLGPKRRQGDYQVPEGFYYIDRFNPASSYYLSLGINYPNAADRIKSKAKDKGGDIFIHGSCVTIGCLPMTDDKIKEIYLYAAMAKNSGQKRIPVYIFPFEMKEEKFKTYAAKYAADKELLKFWENIKKGFSVFDKNKKELKFSIDVSGNYIF